MTYGGKEVKLEDVLDILGVADAELVLDARRGARRPRPQGRAARRPARCRTRGATSRQFMRDLSAHLRHLFVVQTLGEVPDSFSVTAEHTDRLGAAGRAHLAGRAPARDRLPGGGDRGGQGRLRAAHPARDGAAQGHPAAGRPLAPGADVPDRAARAAPGWRGADRARSAAGDARRPRRSGSGAARARRAAPTRAAAGGPVAAVAVEPRAEAEAVGPSARRARAAAGALAGGRRGGGRGERHARRGARRGPARRGRGRPAHGRVPGGRRLREEEGGGRTASWCSARCAASPASSLCGRLRAARRRPGAGRRCSTRRS